MMDLKSLINVGEPLFSRNLLLFPMYPKEKTEIDCLSLDESLSNGASIHEIKVVNTVRFINRSQKRVFALDGEEIVGAMQNRVLNTAFFAERDAELELPVVCVEEYRWEGTKQFQPGYTSSNPSLRAILCESSTRSLRRDGTFHANQDAIWRSISTTLKSLKVSSETSSMHDAFTTLEDEIKRFTEGVEFKKACGMVSFIGNRFLCMDYFVSPDLFQKYSDKLLKGYGMEALLNRTATSVQPERTVETIVNNISQLRWKSYPSLSIGEEFRTRGKKLVGRALIADDKIIHLACFSSSR